MSPVVTDSNEAVIGYIVIETRQATQFSAQNRFTGWKGLFSNEFQTNEAVSLSYLCMAVSVKIVSGRLKSMIHHSG
ncbi:MAG: hypothetical protein ACR2PX_26930 [Endozoicomonas sp.]|uniref:hypothetical protein n=1 Tax=Endozoicomonas sp. TaxID=1892382 RepID=UPI003D9AF9B3